MIVTFPPLSNPFQTKDFTPAVIKIDEFLSALCHKAFDSEEYISMFTIEDARQAAIRNIA